MARSLVAGQLDLAQVGRSGKRREAQAARREIDEGVAGNFTPPAAPEGEPLEGVLHEYRCEEGVHVVARGHERGRQVHGR